MSQLAPYIRDDLKGHWPVQKSGQVSPQEKKAQEQNAPDADAQQMLDQAFAMQGEIFRDVAGRRTLRVQLDERWFFLKVHPGVGWGEIVKNWVQFKRPVLGAENEYLACRDLESLGIRAPRVAAFAQSNAIAPYRRSFVLCDELADHINLEDVAAQWVQTPPTALQLRALLIAVAKFARRFHEAGFIHRDFYLCHLLIHENDFHGLDAAVPELGVLDLHRARRFERIPERWLKRDLAALLFSSMDLTSSQFSWLRFIRIYSGRPLAQEFAERGAFWREVKARADGLYAQGLRKGIVTGRYQP